MSKKKKAALNRHNAMRHKTAELEENLRILEGLRSYWHPKINRTATLDRIAALKLEIEKTIREHHEAPARVLRLNKDIKKCKDAIARLELSTQLDEYQLLMEQFESAAVAAPPEVRANLIRFASARARREAIIESSVDARSIEIEVTTHLSEMPSVEEPAPAELNP